MKIKLGVFICLILAIGGCLIYLLLLQSPLITDSENILAKNKEIFQKQVLVNDDIVRLIYLSDRTLPVVQSKDNKEYLNLDLSGKYDKMGTLFQAKEVNQNSLNIVIYGHSSSKNNLRLTPLKNSDYIKKNISFLVLEKGKEVRYQIIGYLNMDMNNLSLPFYRTTWRNRSEFLNFLKQANSLSLVDFNLLNEDDIDQSLTLVTCDLRKKSKRWVIIAVCYNEENE